MPAVRQWRTKSDAMSTATKTTTLPRASQSELLLCHRHTWRALSESTNPQEWQRNWSIRGREMANSQGFWAVVLLCAAASVGAQAPAPGPSSGGGGGDDQPENFGYYQIWADQAGETHFTRCLMKGFNLTAYALLPQYVRSDFGGPTIAMVLTELPVGFTQGLHSAPAVQFVATLSGSWYTQTSDGTRFEYQKGDLLFQDNTPLSPANKPPQHYSGTVGNQPCHQLVVQIFRIPQVDQICPF